jgi:hypothetical protein
METGGSLPCSQQPATGPYPEPDASSPHSPNLFPNVHSNSVFPSMSKSSKRSVSSHLSHESYIPHTPDIPLLMYEYCVTGNSLGSSPLFHNVVPTNEDA